MIRAAITRQKAIFIVLNQDGRCAICKAKLRPDNIHYDHRIPLALGGADTLENLQAICAEPCHAKKTNGRPHTSLNSDRHAIAKSKRILGGKKYKGPKLQSRGFDKTLRKRISGKVETRT